MIEPRVGATYPVLLEGKWTVGEVTPGGIVVIGSPVEWPRSLVEQWGPELHLGPASAAPHPGALVPHPDMLADRWRPAEGATYQARAGSDPVPVTGLVAVVYRVGYGWGFRSGYDTGFGEGHAVACRDHGRFEGEFGDGEDQ